MTSGIPPRGQRHPEGGLQASEPGLPVYRQGRAGA